ncbi:putative pteridine reductase [Trypanosoma vivax]|uniref:Putative pteridine reductase n=1 Tax=Trypanosoma vivax (strain Y486) TaxID=1055687 RepID=G0U0G3_TRYVY|nr:putative pteridine reductase [Trypanosoma vivax]CCC49561.1 putative pteridine reductase [Trypanosoma vivax Y486]
MECPAVVITGAAKRIGRSIALRLHKDGFRVLIHYHRSVREAESLMAELNSSRENSAALCCADLTFDNALLARCEEVVDCCFRVFGRCDALINNASAFYPTPLLENSANTDDSVGAGEKKSAELQIAQLLGTNAIAPLFLIRAFATRQRQDATVRGKWRNLSVVNLCDAMADQPYLGFTTYTMGKHALIGLTKSAAVELAAENIRVNGVSPGISVLPKDMAEEEREEWRRKVPLGRREASTAQIADAVAFLVSEGASYVTGSILKVDGGLSLAHV